MNVDTFVQYEYDPYPRLYWTPEAATRTEAAGLGLTLYDVCRTPF